MQRAGRVDLLVPINALQRAKSRLRGAADDGVGDPDAHARLTLAMARDTIAAARDARLVDRVLAVSPDPEVLAALSADGVPVLVDRPDRGLNPALQRGAAAVRRGRRSRSVMLGALQADLAALRPAELDAALEQAGQLFASGDAVSAFCPDAAGVGTTLLLAAPGAPLVARFGPGSAAAHELAGARRLLGAWPGLQCDVDTPADLEAAGVLGLGIATRTALSEGRRSPVLRSTGPDQ